MTHYTFLVNPKASSGSGEKVWKRIEPELKKRKISYNVIFTTPECGATEAARKITEDGKQHTVIVLGGDGTINEVVNGVCYPEKITLGFIPTGSGNDFTRALNLPTNPLEALETVLNPGNIVPLDIGVVQLEKQKPRRFAVSTGIGFDASVCHQVDKSPFKSVLNTIHLGNLIYLGVALRKLFFDPLVEGEVILDEGEPMKFSKMYFTAVMNHPYEGGGFFFCPDAKMDDGVFDVIVVAGIWRLKVLFLLPTAFFGRHTGFNGVWMYRCRKVEIRVSEVCPIHTDGEPVAVGRMLKVGMEEEQIRVMVKG